MRLSFERRIQCVIVSLYVIASIVNEEGTSSEQSSARCKHVKEGARAAACLHTSYRPNWAR